MQSIGKNRSIIRITALLGIAGIAIILIFGIRWAGSSDSFDLQNASVPLSTPTDTRRPPPNTAASNDQDYQVIFPLDEIVLFPQSYVRFIESEWSLMAGGFCVITLPKHRTATSYERNPISVRPGMLTGQGLMSPSGRLYVWHCIREYVPDPDAKLPLLLKWLRGKKPSHAWVRESLWLLPGDLYRRKDRYTPPNVTRGRCYAALIGETSARAPRSEPPDASYIQSLKWDKDERSLTYQLDGHWYRVALPPVDVTQQP